MENLSPEQKNRLSEELKKFEQDERKKLNLVPNEPKKQWFDACPVSFTLEERPTTTVLTTGLSENTLYMVSKVLKPTGLNFQPFKTPGNSAYELGKEYGNRGQCNPTYFTVGSLIEHLMYLRDKEGISTQDIIKNYIYVTANGCGPCRMGMYATEYRKALRDSGFEGFRVILLSRSGEADATQSSGLSLPIKTFVRGFSAIILSDILNLIHHRFRPYEAVPGSVEKAVFECRDLIGAACEHETSILMAAWKCRKIVKKLKLNRLQVKPRVLIQGEFWAKQTEGEGNYNLFSFLRNEGSEPVIELLTDWLLHQLWRADWAVKQREDLKQHDDRADGMKGSNFLKTKLTLKVATWFLKKTFNFYLKMIGPRDYHLTDHQKVAELAHEHMDIHLDGGEDHMEVGHHILNAQEKHANMVLSVKPFTCLSSNGASDGIQPVVSELYPDSIFLTVETNADAPANFYGRVQMQLFKAKQAAQKEVDEALKKTGLTMQKAKELMDKNPKFSSPFYEPRHDFACPAANLIMDLKHS